MNAVRNSRYYYGSAAPVLEPAKIRQSKNEYIQRAEMRQEEMVRAQAKTGSKVSFGQALVILFCMLFLSGMAAVYVVGLSGLKSVRNKIAATRIEIENCQKENALLSLKIEEERDYEAIYRYATETLGMHLPEKRQVITYVTRPSEFVLKSKDIPNE